MKDYINNFASKVNPVHRSADHNSGIILMLVGFFVCIDGYFL